MHNGKIPNGMQIDHIDHNKTNNKIDNLRLVTPKENNHNMKFRVTNKSGVTGVSWDKQHKAEVKYNFHENHGK